MSSESSISMFTLDVLPPKCSVESQLAFHKSNCYIRFRAEMRYGWGKRKTKTSDWTPWQRFYEEPVQLKWKDFWRPQPKGNNGAS